MKGDKKGMTIDNLLEQQKEFQFDTFTNDDALQLGLIIVKINGRN